jgi:predicted dehydrogenase
VIFVGNGPVRTFPGILDYGAHALSLLHDLLGPAKLVIKKASSTLHLPGEPRKTLNVIIGSMASTDVTITVGNGARLGQRQLTATFGGDTTLRYEEQNHRHTLSYGPAFTHPVRLGRTMVQEKDLGEQPHDPLLALVKNFLSDTLEGKVNPAHASLATTVAESLSKIQRAVSSSP